MLFGKKPFERSPLSRRLLVYIVVSSIAIVSLATAGELYLLYRSDIASIEETLEHVKDSYVPAISSSLYALDEDQMDLLLQGALNLSAVAHIEVTVFGDSEAGRSYGNANASKDIVRRFVLLHESPGGNVSSYGQLTVVASFDKVIENLWHQGAATFIISIGTMLLIATTVHAIIQRTLTRHLDTITEYHKSLTMETLDVPLALKQPNFLTTPPYELEDLADAINTMRVRLLENVLRRREMEEKLRSSEHLSRTILDTAPVPLAISRLADGIVRFVSPAAEQLFGLKSSEIIGRYSKELYADPSDREKMVEILQRDGKVIDYELRLKRSDGTPLWVSLSGQVAKFEGEDVFIVGFADITARKNTEKALRQSQKMEAVGQLTGGIAHDFNNMLGVIMGNLELLRRKVTHDPKAAEYVEEAYKGSLRGAAITKKLLSFASQSSTQPQLVDVNEFIVGMEKLIAKVLTPRIEVRTHLADNIWPINIDPSDFEDALLNLSLNARDAMVGGGALEIVTDNKVLDDWYVLNNPEASVGEYVMISVCDTGAGMTPDVLEQSFQPFFSTKDKSQGTGLGLSMVYGFVQRSGGHIKAYSEVGVGTTIRIYVPRATDGEGAAQVSHDAISSKLPGGDETILIVDDETGLLNVATTYLQDLGYQTLTATTGQQALEITKHADKIDLVLSDVVMPGELDGYSLAQKVLRFDANIKVLLTSGFASHRGATLESERTLLEKLSQNLLSKPYTQAELAVAVRRILDGGN